MFYPYPFLVVVIYCSTHRTYPNIFSQKRNKSNTKGCRNIWTPGIYCTAIYPNTSIFMQLYMHCISFMKCICEQTTWGKSSLWYWANSRCLSIQTNFTSTLQWSKLLPLPLCMIDDHVVERQRQKRYIT